MTNPHDDRPPRPEHEPEPWLLSRAQAARLVALSPSTIRDAIHRGELPALVLKRRVRIEPEALRSWLVRTSTPYPSRAPSEPRGTSLR